MTGSKTLILGGVRSGKSRLAERLATESGRPVTYIATATARDDEMRARIAAHRAHRPDHWHLIEEPVRLAAALREHAVAGHCILVDCLTLWLTNLLTAEDAAALERERAALLDVLPTLPGRIILVSNETNMGITPLGELSRRYCDAAGLLHQALAQCCDGVILTVAGLPHILKGEPV
jgi:adenosylcobinamide kinase/adenosylcobinamide-phosphate guanylyltransferase